MHERASTTHAAVRIQVPAPAPRVNGAHVAAPDHPGPEFDGRPLHHSRMKRAFDVVGALLLITVLLPLLLAVAALVRVGSPGPLLFRQVRVGAGGKVFVMLKFRSMRADAEEVLRADKELYSAYLANDYKLPPGEDPRLAPAGRFIRTASLDELPQLWNVLRGEMSLVGPRPVLPEEIYQYGSARHAYCATRPGLTGAWQVAGRCNVDYPERVELDRNYVEQWSLARDIAILAKTPSVVVSRRGAH